MGFRSYFDSSSSGGGGGGTPGGVNGDLQYNNAGAFGGLTPGAGVTTLLAGTPSGTGGLAGTTSPTFTTPVLGVATAASLAIGGATIGTDGLGITGNVSFSGILKAPNGNAGVPSYTFTSFPTYGIYFNSSAGTVFTHNGTDAAGIRTAAFVVPSSGVFEWTSGGITSGIDTGISRISAGLIAVGNGGGASFVGNLKLTLIGLGVTPTYGIHGAWTTGLTANQTMLIQDAGASGSTGIFFNAGASQSANPVLTVQGSNSIQAAGTVKGTLTTLVNAVTGLVAGALAALTNASLVITDGAGTVYRIPCVTP